VHLNQTTLILDVVPSADVSSLLEKLLKARQCEEHESDDFSCKEHESDDFNEQSFKCEIAVHIRVNRNGSLRKIEKEKSC